jgi:DNA-binding NarL/FixJ family response regulator
MELAVRTALLPIVDRIYESVERPELWPETIHRIGECIGGRLGFWGIGRSELPPGAKPELNKHFRRAGSHTFLLSREDLKVLDQYVDEFGELILRFLKIICVSTLFSQKEVDSREIIGVRLARRYLPAFESAAGTSVSIPSRPALRKLIAALWEDGCVLGDDDLNFIRILIPHLDRALRLQLRMTAAELKNEIVSGALDCLALGVMFVNRTGVPIWLNQRARELTNSSEVLRFSSSGIIGRSPSDTRSLRELVEGAAAGGTQTVLAVNRGLDARPLLLIAVPLQPIGSTAFSNALPRGVVFISDPDRVDKPSVDSLRQAFDLTYREAQVAIAIARGHGLQAAAQSMGVAVTTARSQLQQAFTKTGTSQQAELAALVHRTLAALRHTCA